MRDEPYRHRMEARRGQPAAPERPGALRTRQRGRIRDLISPGGLAP